MATESEDDLPEFELSEIELPELDVQPVAESPEMTDEGQPVSSPTDDVVADVISGLATYEAAVGGAGKGYAHVPSAEPGSETPDQIAADAVAGAEAGGFMDSDEAGEGAESAEDDGTGGDGEGDDDTRGGRKRRRRRKRDPFKDMPRTYSRDAALSSRRLTSLSQLKQVKRARVRHEGKRVITDDVKKLKSLSIEPRLPAGEFVNYYVEPVRIEYYIPKESRFAVETKFLYIALVDPVPREQDDILSQNMEQERFIDMIDVMNEYPQYITDLLESYNNTMKLFESLSAAMYGADTDEEQYKTAFYLAEILLDYEPSLASLEFMGDFMIWNMNWLIRRMNLMGIEFSASDKTVSFMIKRRNIWWEANDYDYDERFEILAALFFEQAYPNRGFAAQGDYVYGAFD